MSEIEIGVQIPVSVKLTQRVKNLQDHLIASNGTNEISWYGSVLEPAEGQFIVDDIFVPEQEVTGGTTRATDAGFAKLHEFLRQTDAGQDKLRRLFYWGHSHVNMAPNPSAQDVQTLGSLVQRGYEKYIRGIFNRRGEATVWLCQDGPYFSAAIPVKDFDVIREISESDMAYLDYALKNNVRSAAPAPEAVVQGPTYFGQDNPIGLSSAQQYEQRRRHYQACRDKQPGAGSLFDQSLGEPTHRQPPRCNFDCDNCRVVGCVLEGRVLNGKVGANVGVQNTPAGA